MKQVKLYLSVLTFLLFSFNLVYSQCDDCSNNGIISVIDANEAYSAASAQAYFWEICSGNATIVGSNTNQNVSVQCNEASSALKVTRFVNGNCVESCVTLCPPPPICDIPNSCIDVYVQGSPQKCVLAVTSVDLDCLEEYGCTVVQLSLYLAGQYVHHFPPGQTSGSWDIPNGQWNGTLLTAAATLNCGGLECLIYKKIDLDCWVKGGGKIDPLIQGNQDGNQFKREKTNTKSVKGTLIADQLSFNIDHFETIENVRIYNIEGQPIEFTLDKYSNNITLRNYKTGILKAIITTDKGIYYSTVFAFE